jgi:signal transduction histidine kinase
MEEFLALLAHELRNPLAPIRNATAIMRLRPMDDPNLAWSRDVIDRQARHLTRLIDDLLDVSRITTGKIALAREPMAIADALHQAVEASQPVLESRHQDLVVAIPEEPLWVDADPVRLTQVVVNLLNNAAKFTPEGGQVRLSAGREGNDAVIRVRDSGIGMSAALVPRVFDLFLQGNESKGRAEGGLGVGLTLVRGLVEMHGGSVEAHSEGPGSGSTFVVRLPLLQPSN